MNITLQIAAVQTRLGLVPDGVAGVKTWDEIYKVIVLEGATQETESGPIDDRSEKTIATLLPEVQPVARAFVSQAAQQGITIKIIGGTRTYQEQNALYAQGRTTPGDKVTNARGGFSNHNFGIAFDIGIFQGGRYKGESPLYKAVAVIGKSLGLSWGGDWKNSQDEPHYELKPDWAKGISEGDMVAELRRRHDASIRVFA